MPASDTEEGFGIQKENSLPANQLQTKESSELADNRIGGQWHGLSPISMKEIADTEIIQLGLKRVRLSSNSINWDTIDWANPELIIDPAEGGVWSCEGIVWEPSAWGDPQLNIDATCYVAISHIAGNGVTITYVLNYWDKEFCGEEVDCPRFQTDEEIQRYLYFAQLNARYFKNHVECFEIWNEPDIKDTCIQSIEAYDYINLVRQTIPVIREEYPDAKIKVGGTISLCDPDSYHYLLSILSSDIMPLVDAVSWHINGLSPEHGCWQERYPEYPALVQEIKETAASYGFNGEYIADELDYLNPESPAGAESWPYSDIICAKYYARGIIMNLGMDITVGLDGISSIRELSFTVIRNLCTIMAGAKPSNIPLKIKSKSENIKSYGFSLPDGDRLLALWVDDSASDNYPSASFTLTFDDFTASQVTGIDILDSFEQQMKTTTKDGNLIIKNLLVKDYPTILRLTP